jgi:hypothetical protein
MCIRPFLFWGKQVQPVTGFQVDSVHSIFEFQATLPP